MREIKFRVWDEDTGMMIDVTQMQYDNWGDVDLVLGYAKEDKEPKSFRHTSALRLMQYTGLKDKNGKEIYEGDILDNEGARQKYEVIFHNGCFCISQGGLGYHIFNEKKVEIIGNIYENPELIIN